MPAERSERGPGGPPVVETAYGRVQGVESRGIRVFKGIPYAAAPTGDRRFRAPRPPQPWTGTREAKRPASAAIQASVPGLRFLNLTGGIRQSEDCLSLNIYTPGTNSTRRPVIVWIHGGGFLIGSGTTPIYDGRGLARLGDSVVVTLNYRLGALGYLSLDAFGDDYRGACNAGIRDQIAALEWVRENIDRFGGDPNNLTVCGQSAGAMSIAALIGSPRARGLFHRAICQSGAADHVNTAAEAATVTEVFMGELGIRRPEELGSVDVRRILRAQGATNRRLVNRRKLMCFLPVIDGDLITQGPLEAIRSGAAAHIPLLVGTTLDEWKLFSMLDMPPNAMHERGLVKRFAEVLPSVAQSAPAAGQAAREYREAVRSRGGKTSPFEVWSAFQSARVFHYPASQLADAHVAAGGDAYSYLFTWQPRLLRRSLGAFHAIDVPFLFGVSRKILERGLDGIAPTATKLSKDIQTAWTRFAASGIPASGGLPAWQSYASGNRSTMVLGRRSHLAEAPLEVERSLWQRWSG